MVSFAPASRGLDERSLRDSRGDSAAARVYGDLTSLRRAVGRPTRVPDGQVAAIARVRGFSAATRNAGDFEYCDVELVNPFAPGPT